MEIFRCKISQISALYNYQIVFEISTCCEHVMYKDLIPTDGVI